MIKGVVTVGGYSMENNCIQIDRTAQELAIRVDTIKDFGLDKFPLIISFRTRFFDDEALRKTNLRSL